jgi:magnesium transporter
VSDSVGTAKGPQFEALSSGGVSWIYVDRPSDLESDLLARHYRLRPSHLAEALSERPTVRALESGSYVYLSLETPSLNRLTRTISIARAGVFVGPEFVICVHRGDARPLARLFRECQADEARLRETMDGDAVGLALTILKAMTDPAGEEVEAVRLTLDEMGDALAAADDRGIPLDLAHVERDSATLESVLRGAHTALETLIRYVGRTSLSEEAAEALGLLRERIDRSVDLLQQTRREAEGIARAGEVLAAQQTAGAARLAAGLLAALLPALVLAAFFSLSVKDVPLADYPYAFELLLGISIVVALAALWLLRRRRVI